MNELTTNAQALMPTNLADAMKLAEVLSKSDIVPKDYQGKPGNVLVAVQWGMEVGLGPLQALQNIACINGRPSLWGDAMLALVRGSGLLESFNEEISDTEATCTVKRKGHDPISRTFSITDAESAGLIDKAGPWKQYRKRMLQMRARGWALRDEFTDVLKGIALAEEQQDAAHEKDMGTVTPEPKPSDTLREKVRRAVTKQEPVTLPAITLADITKRINVAKTEDEMNAIKADARQLGEADKDQARDLWAMKMELIRSSRPENVDENGEIS